MNDWLYQDMSQDSYKQFTYNYNAFNYMDEEYLTFRYDIGSNRTIYSVYKKDYYNVRLYDDFKHQASYIITVNKKIKDGRLDISTKFSVSRGDVDMQKDILKLVGV